MALNTAFGITRIFVYGVSIQAYQFSLFSLSLSLSTSVKLLVHSIFNRNIYVRLMLYGGAREEELN